MELLIALSVGLAALHALRPLRPLLPGREAWVAGLFGLVHGLAFAEALATLQLPRGSLLVAVLGFNLGAEALQLLVAALLLPPLMAGRRHRWQPVVRQVLALGALAAAGFWGWQRVAAL